MEDKLYKDIMYYHTESVKNTPDIRPYPSDIYQIPSEKRESAKAKFRHKAKKFNVLNGILVHVEIEVLVKSRLASILHAYHDNPTTGAHLGRDKTCAKIAERYYWYGMKDTISKYIKKCKKCFAVNPKVTKESPPLKSIPVPTKKWSLVGIDLIGPLQETPSGNKYIVAITDHFTKWSEAAGIPDKSAVSVAKFLYNVVCRFGCMDTLISDQGKEFLNDIIFDKIFQSYQYFFKTSTCIDKLCPEL